jgi:hypothetical protein
MKILLTCVLILGFSALSLAASPCSPNWRPRKLYGIQLGMSVKQVRAHFPNLKVSRPNKFRVQDSFFYLVGRSRSQYHLPRSVFAVELLFLQGHLVRYQVKYYDSQRWKNMDEFVSSMSGPLGLADIPSIEGRTFPGYECNNFEVGFWKDSSMSITYLDRKAKPILDEMIEESYRNEGLRD